MPNSINSSVHLEGRSVVEGEVTLQDKTITESPDKVTVTGEFILLVDHLNISVEYTFYHFLF